MYVPYYLHDRARGHADILFETICDLFISYFIIMYALFYVRNLIY
jgi:hypothetical protein